MLLTFLLVAYYLGVLLFFLGGASLMGGAMYYFSGKVLFVEWEIIEFNSTSVIATLLFDWMSLSFAGLVMIISSMVLFYSSLYMGGDKNFVRFILMVYLFVVSMIFMVISPNLIMILLGWDGLGLVSYCLVIYYQNVKSSNAGMITVLSNRIGDVAILLGISWMLNFGAWNFFYAQYLYEGPGVKVMMGLVILAAMTKSAQMPFSAWLPAAMAAPTPVSALVHSSTLVTAGVYLLIRFNYMLGLSSFLFYVGILTMFMSGLGANFETDLKKIIALSTLSQLGLMMMTISVGLVEFSFFHLLTHAMFKSLLFLCAGVFIHSMGDTQDVRLMGGLAVSCPVTSFYFTCSSLALCGAPFLSGFYSKDTILELYFMSAMNVPLAVLIFGATMFTLSYSVRLMYLIFFKGLSGRGMLNLGEEAGMVVPMSLLLTMSVAAGGFMSITYFPVFLIYMPLFVKASVLAGLTMIFVGLFYYLRLGGFKFVGLTSGLGFYLGSMWLLPFISSSFFMPALKLGEVLIKAMDQGWLEYLGGKGAIKAFSKSGLALDLFNLISLKYYIFMGFTLIVFYVMI